MKYSNKPINEISTESMLEVEHLTSGYGNSQILFDLNLRIGWGETATLLGRNGMGKTTTVRSILGLTPAWSGTIRFCGERIDSSRPDQIARLGIAIVPEGRLIFPNLTVEENLLAFASNRSQNKVPWTLESIYELFPSLKIRRLNMGNQLSGGEQQMLAIGRALSTNPLLLILDEATEGLAPLVREDIWNCLYKLRSLGQSILVIDKYVKKLVALADQHTIIEKGRVVWSGDSPQLNENPNIWKQYIGV